MSKSKNTAAVDSAPVAADALIPPVDDGEAKQPEEQTSNQPTPPSVEAADVTVRILVATEVGDITYQPNQLVRFTADVYASLDQARFDASEAAVAYCESIGASVVIHVQGDDGEQS